MGSLTIRNFDDAVKARLRIQAATNGPSMEAEAREILCAALIRPPREAIAVVDLSDEEAAPIAAAAIPAAHRYSLNDA